MKLLSRGFVGMLLLGFILSLAGSSPVQAQEGEAVLGLLLPTTGFVAYYGKQMRLSADMAVEDINKAGGINGKKIRLVFYDTGGKPEEAINSTRRLATSDNVVAIMGPMTSSECRVAYPLANRLGIPIVASACSAPGLGAANRPWAFRNTVLEADVAAPSLTYWAKKHNVKSVVVFYDNKDIVSKSFGLEVMPALLKDNGIKLVDSISVVTGDMDYSAQVTKAKSLNAEGLVLSALANESAGIAREARRQGLKQPMFGGSFLAGPQFISKGGSAVEGVIMGSGFWQDNPDPTIAAFVKRFKEREPSKEPPHQVTVYQYETITIMKYCSEKTGVQFKPETLKQDREKIRDCWQNLRNHKVLSSTMSMIEGDGKRPPLIIEVKGGTFELLKTN
ncbi:MAG: ABC transporter substrate-binding protein [Candidatus Tectomicrobia bacterium]|nr:ABC transporter substrate-binding protein [Candidatus Tectomicrobia bacterium]